MQELARTNRIDITLLRRDIKQWLTKGVLRDSEMTQDFRVAMTQLCLGRMEVPSAEAAIEIPITQWLKGELRAIGALKNAPITARITRHNGRAMLRSACRWLRKCGQHGLCLTLDIRSLGKTRRAAGDRLYYSPGAVMDGFEVLRQLIDDAEHFSGMLLVVLADNTLIGDDRSRSLNAYLALKMRVWDDVRAESRDDPLMPLVRLVPSPFPVRGEFEALP